MKKLSTIFLYALAVVSLAWALPWLFNLLLPDGAKVPYINYSPLSHEFIATDKGESWVVNPDGSRGRDIPTAERDSLLPQQYFVQLSNTGRLADTILGREVSPKILKHSNFVFRSSPRDVNKRYADVYMIMESMPARVDFEDPKEVFRMKDDGTVEFIRIADCSINDDRTKRFTKVFADRGFKFPMADFSANVTTKKPFDAGYLMIDAEGTVYNMLQQAGTPFLKKIVLPDSVKAEKVLVMENNDGKHLGLAVTADGQTFAIGADYSARRLDIDKFDPKVDNMLVMGSIFNWIIRIANDNQISWQVIHDAANIVVDRKHCCLHLPLHVDLRFNRRFLCPSSYRKLLCEGAYPQHRFGCCGGICRSSSPLETCCDGRYGGGHCGVRSVLIHPVLSVKRQITNQNIKQMKVIKFFALSALILGFASCQSGQKDENAQDSTAVAEVAVISVDDLLANPDSLVGQTITIEGVCSHLCKHGGRKAFLVGAGENATPFRCEATEEMGGSFPQETIKKNLRVTGVLVEDRIDEEYVKSMEEQNAAAEKVAKKEGNDANKEESCETETKAQGQDAAASFANRMADYRARIAERQAKEGKPYLSFYHLDAKKYEIVNDEK